MTASSAEVTGALRTLIESADPDVEMAPPGIYLRNLVAAAHHGTWLDEVPPEWERPDEADPTRTRFAAALFARLEVEGRSDLRDAVAAHALRCVRTAGADRAGWHADRTVTAGLERVARLRELLVGRPASRAPSALERACDAIRAVRKGARGDYSVLCPVVSGEGLKDGTVIALTITALGERTGAGREELSLELAPWSYFRPREQTTGTWLDTWRRELAQLAARRDGPLPEQLRRFRGYLIDLHPPEDPGPASAWTVTEYPWLAVKGESIGFALVLGALGAGLALPPKPFAATGKIGANGPGPVSPWGPKLEAVMRYARARASSSFPYYCPPFMDNEPVPQRHYDAGEGCSVSVQVLARWADVWNQRSALFTDWSTSYRTWLLEQLRSAESPGARVFNDTPSDVARAELRAALGAGDDGSVPFPFLLPDGGEGSDGWIVAGIKAGLGACFPALPPAGTLADTDLRNLVSDRYRLRLIAFSRRSTEFDSFGRENERLAGLCKYIDYFKEARPRVEVVASDDHHRALLASAFEKLHAGAVSIIG
jgi:hypothetical protein